jgi:hypothetical protein
MLGAVAIVSAVGELIGAFFIDFAPAAYAAAALFVVGWFFVRRRSIAGVAIVGILSVVELAGLAFYKRETAADWTSQVVFLILGAVGLVAAIGALRSVREAG